MIRWVHPIAGMAAGALIVGFQAATIRAELSGSLAEIRAVKEGVLYALPVLAICLMTVGGSGRALAGPRPKGVAQRKRDRMKLIAANGLIVLVPAAVFLHWRAQTVGVDAVFQAVQAVEIVAGLTNLVLIGRSARDGLRLSGRLRRRPSR
ncbi:hypothetical protein [Ponticoccus alexandrii]|uniref:Transmembrane protein n=1 Tax=Ponticoccus alexandrii TaxID=1943633 RepID=A0ABX7F5R2_9RHOB|nr:hypothetical protein [Ponticoccus alexandrii]ETA53376.1 hypothetical protein P279_03720 [Rhodobacteraceae bacterium PD-2]QRF65870.1 hypothetical protein GQA70_05815 [Ponticoccus alexandrii]